MKRGRPKGSKNKAKEPVDPNATEAEKQISLDQKRAARAEKQAAKYAEQKFSYTPLAETALGNTSLYYIAGVLIDATLPHQNPKTNKYACYMKIIDATMCYRESQDLAAAKAFQRN